MTSRRFATFAFFAFACGSPSPEAPPLTTPGGSTTAPLTGFQLTGDPTTAGGATWTFRATVDGTVYDLQGILFKPAGTGPFPAVIVSHGAGGNARGYSRAIAQTMVTWGLVAIATNYTHAGGVDVGSPGTANEPGASVANVRRAERLLDILKSLGYVDMKRVVAHGHSMGAFVTAAIVAADPAAFIGASHSAGGVRPDVGAGAAPTETQVATIAIPYQMHHGDADVVVALSSDQRLASLLTQRRVVNELHVYAGASHEDVSMNATMLDRVKRWYADHGVFK